MAFSPRLMQSAQLVEAHLAARLDNLAAGGAPARLIDAMRHGTLGGGKRFRPFLVLESAALFGVALGTAVETAAAVECVHCYSLIHDDLPAMDNDDLRRGRPTVHKAFDEWTAILAGDALLTLAFEILSGPATHADPAIRAELVAGLARASGGAGMAGGQCLDLEAEKLGSARAAVGFARAAPASDEDGRAVAVLVRSGRHPGTRRRRAAPRARELRRLHRPRVPDCRRSARHRRRRGRDGQGRRQRCRQGDIACRERRSQRQGAAGGARGGGRCRACIASDTEADTLREAASFVVRRER